MSARARQDLKGWHVLTMLIAFFLAVVAVNSVFLVAALDTFPGEDEPRSYLQGLRYNDTIAAREAQARLGWRAEAMLAEHGDHPFVDVVFLNGAGAPLDGLTIRGVLRHPADKNADRALAFEALGGGRYRARLDALPPGAWLLRADAARGQDHFTFERRQTWRPPSR